MRMLSLLIAFAVSSSAFSQLEDSTAYLKTIENFALRIQDCAVFNDVACLNASTDYTGLIDRMNSPVSQNAYFREAMVEELEQGSGMWESVQEVVLESGDARYIGHRMVEDQSEILFRLVSVNSVNYLWFRLDTEDTTDIKVIDVYSFAYEEYISGTVDEMMYLTFAAMVDGEELTKESIEEDKSLLAEAQNLMGFDNKKAYHKLQEMSTPLKSLAVVEEMKEQLQALVEPELFDSVMNWRLDHVDEMGSSKLFSMLTYFESDCSMEEYLSIVDALADLTYNDPYLYTYRSFGASVRGERELSIAYNDTLHASGADLWESYLNYIIFSCEDKNFAKAANYLQGFLNEFYYSEVELQVLLANFPGFLASDDYKSVATLYFGSHSDKEESTVGKER